MAYDARAIANLFLGFGSRDSSPISPLKMQKLAYLAHGWSLVMRGTGLVATILKHGPTDRLFQSYTVP